MHTETPKTADPTAPESTPRPAIVVLAPDLFFATRFADVIRAQGGQPVIVETPDAFVAAVDAHFPVLALLDLNASDGWQAALQRVKLRPATRQVPVIAFGSHVEADVLRAARAAGADRAWPRSKLMGDLPQIIADAVQPPVRYVEGWDAPLPAEAAAGVAAFNRGDFFEQHEHFEHAWLQETRPIRDLYQGILLVGVAFHQIELNNWAGALKTFRRGLPRLRDLPPVCQGIDVASLRAAAEEIHREITALGPERLPAFDRSRFPQIRLVDDLRTLSLAESGQLPLVMERVDVGDLLADVVTSFGALAESAGVELGYMVAEPLPPPIQGDAGRLDQVLSNLVQNALRHTPVGGRITLSAARAADHVQIAVADTGDGIPPEDLPFIFDRFWRGDRARSPGGGTGLGLAIAAQLVKAHGGAIGVTSRPGDGTTFTLDLPAASEGDASLRSA